MVLLGVRVILEEFVGVVQDAEHLPDRHDKRFGGEVLQIACDQIGVVFAGVHDDFVEGKVFLVDQEFPGGGGGQPYAVASHGSKQVFNFGGINIKFIPIEDVSIFTHDEFTVQRSKFAPDHAPDKLDSGGIIVVGKKGGHKDIGVNNNIKLHPTESSPYRTL